MRGLHTFGVLIHRVTHNLLTHIELNWKTISISIEIICMQVNLKAKIVFLLLTRLKERLLMIISQTIYLLHMI